MFLGKIQQTLRKLCGAHLPSRQSVLYASLSSLLIISCGALAQNQSSPFQGIHKIRHVIIIMQENRSFDSYFGTFPGADGLPTKDGAFTVCNPNIRTGQCMSPYHDTNDENGGGSHGAAASLQDIDNGKMDGFVIQAETVARGCSNVVNTACAKSANADVMGYHDGRDIPNYWEYARRFALLDNFFSSLPGKCQNNYRTSGSPA